MIRKRAKHRRAAVAEPIEPRVLFSINMFTVTNTGDSGPGSLRQAILDVSTTSPGLDSIYFNIPGSGVHTIQPLTALPDITNRVLIDGYSQPGAHANDGARLGNDALLTIEIDGRLAPAPLMLDFTGQAVGSELEGVCLNHAGGIVADAAVSISGNFLGTDPTGMTASGSMGTVIDLEQTTDSSISTDVIANGAQYGILLNGGTGNMVSGNLIGIGADGSTPLGNRIGVALRNHAGAQVVGNVISGSRAFAPNDPEGGRGIDALDSFLDARMNRIGTDAAGTHAVPNNGAGLVVRGTTNTTCSISGNTISGNDGDGIEIAVAGSANAAIDSNQIGTDSYRMHALGNGGSGVVVDANSVTLSADVISANASHGVDCHGSQIQIQSCEIGIGGGAVVIPNLGNGGDGVRFETGTHDSVLYSSTVAYNRGNGATVGLSPADATTFNVSVSKNQIYANRGMGIDVGNDGPTPNSAGGEPGPNGRQNYPVITYVRSTSTATYVSGSAHAGELVEFFANPPPTPGSYAQGQTLLGWVHLTSDTFTDLPIGEGDYPRFVGGTAGQVLTALALAPGGNTSEFSPGIRIALSGDLNADGIVNFQDLLILAQHYGTPGTPDQGDINNDGRVDFSDVLILAQNYGQTAPAATTTPVAARGIDDLLAHPARSNRRARRIR